MGFGGAGIDGFKAEWPVVAPPPDRLKPLASSQFNLDPKTSASPSDASELAFETMSLTPLVTTVPDAPSYLEPYSTFRAASGEILRTVAWCLEQRRIDFRFKREKSQIKAMLYDESGYATKIYISLFRNQHAQMNATSSAPEFFLEFQRRSGCVVSFNRLVSKLASQLSVFGVSRLNATSDPAKAKIDTQFSADHAGASADIQKRMTALGLSGTDAPLEQHQVPSLGDVALDRETCDRLVAMASCKEVDVAREGLRCLAVASRSGTNKRKLAELELSVPAALSAASSHQRLDATPALPSPLPAARAKQSEDRKSEDTKVGVELITDLLSRLLRSSDTEISRLSATLLRNLVTSGERPSAMDAAHRRTCISKLLFALSDLLARETSSPSSSPVPETPETEPAKPRSRLPDGFSRSLTGREVLRQAACALECLSADDGAKLMVAALRRADADAGGVRDNISAFISSLDRFAGCGDAVTRAAVRTTLGRVRTVLSH